MSSTPIIEVEDLVKVYGKGEKSTRAVAGITFRVESGTLFGLLGPNGAGKALFQRLRSADLEAAA